MLTSLVTTMQFINEGSKERYSSVSGKKIKMKLTKTAEDLEAERRRKALLSNLNSFYECTSSILDGTDRWNMPQ